MYLELRTLLLQLSARNDDKHGLNMRTAQLNDHWSLTQSDLDWLSGPRPGIQGLVQAPSTFQECVQAIQLVMEEPTPPNVGSNVAIAILRRANAIASFCSLTVHRMPDSIASAEIKARFEMCQRELAKKCEEPLERLEDIRC